AHAWALAWPDALSRGSRADLAGVRARTRTALRRLLAADRARGSCNATGHGAVARRCGNLRLLAAHARTRLPPGRACPRPVACGRLAGRAVAAAPGGEFGHRLGVHGQLLLATAALARSR